MKFACTALLAALAAAPVFAGSIEPAPVYTPVPVPVPMTRDWTGGSVGIQLGYGAFDTSDADDDYEETGAYGLKAYYDYDMGSWVVGGGVQYDWIGAEFGQAGELTGILRIGARAGYDAGNTMIYGTGGYARASHDGGSLDVGDSDGYFIGFGSETFVSDTWTIGAELVYSEFDDFDESDLSLDTTQLNISLNYRY
ncbi:outer membrane protein [Alloyangia pacifica]|uniref:outer membrane protein n=1 Tax=Alloyangia pacifica TaxID=311180 RepID=UPI001CD78067|nr:outer membrane beta-barrel protein [Alloyangia pacifica]MCA0996808.1 porin family protein [Alloyangia pacifica]